MEIEQIAEPTATYCAHCNEEVVPMVVEDGTGNEQTVELIGLTHARTKSGHHYHGECPHCHRPLFSPVAEDLNSKGSRFDWQTLLFVVGGIAFMVIIFFAFNR